MDKILYKELTNLVCVIDIIMVINDFQKIKYEHSIYETNRASMMFLNGIEYSHIFHISLLVKTHTHTHTRTCTELRLKKQR